MRFCAGLTSAKLTLFSRLGATSGATDRQGLFLFGCHSYMMHRCSANKCSIVTTPFMSGSAFLRVVTSISHQYPQARARTSDMNFRIQ